MDRNDIETISVSEVKMSIAQSDYLDQFIPDNDKEPSWDGHVYIYKKKDKKKSNIKGRMPVQVKGTAKSDLSKSVIKHSVSVTDLNNYLSDGGVIYFVVYIKGNGRSRKIYYLEMTPLKIKSWLKNIGERKSKTLSFKEFPDDGNEKASIFRNCYEDCHKQKSYANTDLPTIDELINKGVLEEITFSATGYSPKKKDPMDLIFADEIYLYAKTTGNPIPQPLELLNGKLFATVNRKAKVSSNGVVYYNSINVTHSKDDITIKIGESYNLIFPRDSNQMTLKYQSSGKMRIFAKDLEFQLAVLDNGGFYIDDEFISVKKSEITFNNFDIAEKKTRLSEAKQYVKLLDKLNAGDLIISKLSQQEWTDLKILTSSVVEGETTMRLKNNLPTHFTINLQDYNFALLCLPMNKEHGEYNIYDFFEKEIDLVAKDDSEEVHPISQYALLNNSKYHEITNVNLDILVDSFMRIEENRINYTYANFAVLNLINSYDKTQNKAYLNAANDLCTWIIENGIKYIDYETSFVNITQINIRERNLNSNEMRELYRLLGSAKGQLAVAINILLNNYDDAMAELSLLNDEERKAFESWPIFNLMNK